VERQPGPSRRVWRDQRGITGLETAIILIAFVVVASVFAYTVLTAGIFSSQKSSEAIHSGLSEARSSIVLKAGTLAFMDSVDIDGNTATNDTQNAVVKVAVTIGVALQGTSVDLTPAFRVNPATGYLETTGAVEHLRRQLPRRPAAHPEYRVDAWLQRSERWRQHVGGHRARGAHAVARGL